MSPLEKRRKRVRDIRMRVAAIAVSLFIVVFSGITVQLASGHDPALSKSSAKTTTTSTPATPTTSTGSGESDDSGSTSQAQSSTLPAVTTSQS